MPVHDWTRVSAGDFHDFHSSWITHLKEALNEGILPEGFYAQSEQQAGRTIADILTLATRETIQHDSTGGGGVALVETPPQVSFKMVADDATAYRTARRTITIRHRSGHHIVALVEVLSPGNKDSQQHLRQFVDKAVSALWQGIHLLVIDLHPPGSFDPNGIHFAIWNEVGSNDFELPKDRPLTLAAYLADQSPEAFVEPVAVDMMLPEMPLFINADRYVNVPLEQTYMTSFRGVPDFVRHNVGGQTS